MDDPELDDLDPDELLGDLDDLDEGLFGKTVPKASATKGRARAASKEEPPNENVSHVAAASEDLADVSKPPAAPGPSSGDRKSRLMSELFDGPPSSPARGIESGSRPSSGTRLANTSGEKPQDSSDDVLGDLGLDTGGGGRVRADAKTSSNVGRKLGGSMFDSLLGPSPGVKQVAKAEQVATGSPKKSVSFVLDEKYKKKTSPERHADEPASAGLGYTLASSSSEVRESRMSRAQRASSTASFAASSEDMAGSNNISSFGAAGDGEGPPFTGEGRRKKSSRQSSPSAAGGSATNWLDFGDSNTTSDRQRGSTATLAGDAKAGGDIWASLGFKSSPAAPSAGKKETSAVDLSPQPQMSAVLQQQGPSSTTASNESFFSTQTLFPAPSASVASFSPAAGTGPDTAMPMPTSSFTDINSHQVRAKELRWQQMMSEQEEAFRKHVQAFKEKQVEMQRSNENLERLAKEKLLEQQQAQLLVMQHRQQEEMQRQMTSFMVMMQEMRQQQMMSALEQQELLLRCQANPLASAVNPATLAGMLALQGISAMDHSKVPAAESLSAADIITTSLALSKSDNSMNAEKEDLRGPMKSALDISEEIIRLKGELRRLEIDREQWKSAYDSAVSAHSNEIKLLTESHESQRKLLQDSVERANGRHLTEIGALTEDHSRQMVALEANHEASVKRYLSMLETKDKEREETIAELEDKHRSVLESVKRSHAEVMESMLKSRALEKQANEALASKSGLLEPLVEQLRMQMADLHNLKAKLDQDSSTLDESKALMQQNAELRLQVENETLTKDNRRLLEDLEECKALLKRKEEELKAMRVDMEEEKWALSRARQKLEKEKQELSGEKSFWESQREREISNLQTQREEFEEFAQKMRADLNKQKHDLLLKGESMTAREAVDSKLRSRANLHYNQEKLQAEAALEALAEEHAKLEHKRKDVEKQENLLKREEKELEEQWHVIRKEKDHLKDAAATMKELKEKLARERAECLRIKEGGERAFAEAKRLGSSYAENEKRLAELLRSLIQKEDEMKTEQDRLYVDKQTLASQKDHVFICQLCSNALVDTGSFADILQGTSMDAVDLPYDEPAGMQTRALLANFPLNQLSGRIRQQRQRSALDSALLDFQAAGNGGYSSTARVPKGRKGVQPQQGVPKMLRQTPTAGQFLTRAVPTLQRSRSLSMRRRREAAQVEETLTATVGMEEAEVVGSSSCLVPVDTEERSSNSTMIPALHSPIVSMTNLRDWQEQAQRDSAYLRSRSVWLQSIEQQLQSGTLFKG